MLTQVIARGPAMKYFSFGDYCLNTLKSEIRLRDKALEIEPQVYGILELLITRHGEVVSRDDIIAAVWDGRIVSNNVIDNRIRAVRAAIGDTGKDQRYIKTYPNRGYKFIGKVRASDEDTLETEAKDLAVDSSKDNIAPKDIEMKSTRLLLRKAALPLAGALLFGLIGVYAFSQSSMATRNADSVNVDAANNQDIYKVTNADEMNALPRMAILPFEMIGERSTYELMPDVFENQFNNSITAIRGITVVALSAGANSRNDFTDYKTLKEDFDLDYVIASKLTPYGEDYKLNVSLVQLDNNSVLFTEVYDLKSSNDGGLVDLPAEIASKATLMTANKLGLSMDGLPTSWRSYDFYLKIEEAKAAGKNGDYEGVKKSSKIFREAIQEEPNYLPAYLLLHSSLSYSAAFFGDDYQALYKEQAELPPIMKKISPNAPETLIINLYTESTVDGMGKGSIGEYDPSDPASVMNYILEKDPDHVEASFDAAYLSAFKKDQPETVKAYENLIRLLPTEAEALLGYYQALFCNEEIDKAQKVLQRLNKWHPNHRNALNAQLINFLALGDYKQALIAFKKLSDQGILMHNETKLARALFFDLGYPELALPHVRFAPARSHVYAMMGNKEAALKSASIIPKFYTSVRAQLIAEPEYLPENFYEYSTYQTVGEPNGVTQANACYLDYLMRDTYVLNKIGSEKFDRLLPLLTEYFQDKDPLKLKTQQEYTALMGLHALQGNPDEAIKVMDIAMDRGFLFIGSFKEPHLRELTTYPGVSERIETMKASAEKIVQEYYYE